MKELTKCDFCSARSPNGECHKKWDDWDPDGNACEEATEFFRRYMIEQLRSRRPNPNTKTVNINKNNNHK